MRRCTVVWIACVLVIPSRAAAQTAPALAPLDTSGPEGPPSEVPPTQKPDDWRFGWSGYLRAPLRIGIGSRPPCPDGVSPAAQAAADQKAFHAALGTAGNPNLGLYNGVYCAAPGQRRTSLRSPYVPDDQYYAWTYTRLWEQALGELFLSYGNDVVKGTVGLEAYDFTDASTLGNQASPAQLGIGQAWITVTPKLPLPGAAIAWKVGAFWERFGMAGKYDGGPFDTYMFGRTHQLGESLTARYRTGDVAFEIEHGIGAHLEMVPAGIPIGGSQVSLDYYSSSAPNASAAGGSPGNAYPPGASPGFTLLDHVHAGFSYKDRLDVRAHYLRAWSRDDREQGTLGSSPYGGPVNVVDSSAANDGSLAVAGAEARIAAGALGELYLAYSHVDAKNVTTVGPAIEVLHSAGGGGHNGPNGIYETFFNGVGNGNGRVDALQAVHADAVDLGTVHLSWQLFVLYAAVSGTDASSINLMNGTPTAGTKKLKYGAEVVVSPLPWLGLGARGDYQMPDAHDAHESFGVLAPEVVFRTSLVTHETITLQYAHYWNGADVLPQQWLAVVGVRNVATAAGYAASAATLGPKVGGYVNLAGPVYPPDKDVFGIKATMAW